MWHPGLSYDLFYLWGSEKVGGKGNIRLKAEEEARRTGQPYEEIVGKVRILNLPIRRLRSQRPAARMGRARKGSADSGIPSPI